MGVCKVENLVLEKITSSILSSSERMPDKWMALIFIALLPVVMNLFYKKVNSSYYNIDEKYFNFLSLNKLLVCVYVFIFVILTFAYLFYAFILNFSMLGNIIYFLLLYILCMAISFYICKIEINKNYFFISFLINIGVYLLMKLLDITFKYIIIFFLAISIIFVSIIIINFLSSIGKRAENKCCKNNKEEKFIYIALSSIVIFILSLLSISLLSGIIFSDKVNQNLSNSSQMHLKEDKKRSEDKESYVNKECYIGEERNTNSRWYINVECYINVARYMNKEQYIDENYSDVNNYIDYVLKNSGNLKFNEFLMVFTNPKNLTDIDVNYKNEVDRHSLEEYLKKFFDNVENSNIKSGLFASMRLLILLNLLLDPSILIFAIISLFILIGVALVYLRNSFFNPINKKIYEYIDSPGLMKEVIITEYKDKLLVMEGLIYQENLYLMRSNYRIIDISDTEKFTQKNFKSVNADMLDFVVPTSIIDCNSEEIKCSFDISLNLEKEAINIKNLEYDKRGIDIICDVIFKNGRMIIKSEIKQILENKYGINNFKFKMDESAKKNFSIDENTGEITINLDLK